MSDRNPYGRQNTRGTRGTAARGTGRTQGGRSGYTTSRASKARTAPSRGGSSRTAASRPASNRPASGRNTSGRPASGRTAANRAPVRTRRAPARRKPAKTGNGLVFKWVEALIEAAVIVFILFFVLWPLKSDVTGMSPTLEPGDRVVISRAAAALGFIGQGDIVICAFEGDEGEWGDTMLRVIGKPGDIVSISGGAVSVNGKVLDEKYLPSGIETYPDDFAYLGKTQYYVLGDNRPVSGDSRAFGAVDRRNISAKVVMRFYPFNALKLL